MFYLSNEAAKRLSRSMVKGLRKKHPEIALSAVQEALAQAKGYADWNAFSASFSEESVNALLDEFEREHAHDSGMADIRSEETGGKGYGPETSLRVHTGFILRAPSYAQCPDGADYLRVCDPLGREVAYWSHEEWRAEPMLVLGAIVGALSRGESFDNEPPNEAQAHPTIRDVPFAELDAIQLETQNGSRHLYVDYVEDDALAHVKLERYLTREELEEFGEATAVSASAWEDGQADEEQLSVNFLRSLRWCPEEKLFVHDNGDKVRFILAKVFGR